jgi:hypothetical protein
MIPAGRLLPQVIRLMRLMKTPVRVRLFIPRQQTILPMLAMALPLAWQRASDSALSIDADTGAVTLNADPDHETQSEYNFAVVATDAAGNVSQAQSVTLDINNLDDTAATITSGDTAAAIDENSGAGQVIYTATADDSADVSDGVTFSLADGSDAALSIDAETGAVTLNTDPDHETQSQYSFTVIATDVAGNESAGQSVTLDITDIDDTAATITSGDTAEAIDENSGAGQVIYTATADDSADVSDGFTFSLAEGSDPALSIDENTGAVTLATDADYETQSQYSFSVVATDAAGNHSEAQSVTLDINDLDEVAPTITSASTAAVNENIGQNQVIYTVTSDDTSDISQGVTYSLSETADSALSIDANTGEVSLSTDPDYETQSEYQFTVFATDTAGNQSAAQTVTVSINDLDDSAVSGMVYHWGSQTMMDNVSISMHSQSDGEMMSTMTTDSSGAFAMNDLPSGDVTLTVERDMQADDGNRVVTSADVLAALKIAVGMNPNGSAGGQQNMASPYQFIAADVNKDGRITSADALKILHMAVNMPNATDQEWMFVAEDTDFWNEDAGEGANPFSINKYSVDWDSDGTDMTLTHPQEMNYVGVMLGDVNNSWSAPDDAVKLPQSHLNQLEEDGIAPLDQWNLSPDADIEPPTINPTAADAIVENSGADQVVYTASSFDNSATFSLTADSDPALSINSLSGAVTLAANPDYEYQSQYSFAVVATDAAGNESTAHAVTVEITNIDDAAPTITSADTAVAVDENSGMGQVVYTATATDDADTSGGVTFSLTGDSDPALSIDPSTGAVTLSADADADYETQSVYSFTVVASDGVNGDVEQSVTLDINNLDEIAPSITSGDTAVAIDENTGADTVIYTAIADDSLDISAGVTFSLTGDSDPALSIDPSTGAVTLSADADYEVQSVYSFTVVVSDGVNADVEQAVILDINNLDEIAPTLTSGDTAVAIDENTGADTVIYTAIADDSLDTSDGVTFSLSFDSDPALSIDPSTGTVTLSADADYEVQSVYSFTVVATDAAGNESFPQSVSLEINNLDEVAPTITSDYSAGSIDENSGSYQLVYTATADDSLDTSDGVTFSLADDSDPALFIDSLTGEVTLMDNPDYEAQDFYSFTVVAIDAAGNESEQYVTLDINNLDEIAPSITSGDTAIAVNENSGADQVVYTATATDDADTSDGFSFSLADDSLGFSIDADTGVVITNDDFTADYEDAQSQSFTVVATDAAGNASEQVVSVEINNLDEVEPSITSGDTATAIDENSGEGQVVYTANATDTDANVEVVTFSLADDTLGFSIDADTGVVTTNADFAADFEAAQSQSFTVVATDIAGNASEQAVTVAVNDLDDSGDDTPTETVINIPELQAATQHVYVSSSEKSEDGTQETVVVTYNADAGNTGLGLRIHFDSSAVSVASLDNVLAGTVFANSTPTADTDNKDNDASTDSYIDMAWASLFGGWPGTTPANLATVTFDILEGASGSTAINFSSSSNASGFTFSGQDQVVVLSSGSGDSTDQEAPIITSGDTGTAIDENSGAGQVVYTATATDANIEGVIFSLADDGLGFSIDADTGVVTTNTDFTADYENAGSQSFAVVATDVAGNASEPQLVTLDINDLDETPVETVINIPELQAATQHVYVSESTKSEDGSQETVVVTYNAYDTSTTGLGLRIHFDSSTLLTTDITALTTSDLLVNGVIEADSGDFDGDVSTDKYIAFGWASLFGQWPGSTPTDLAIITFDIAEDAAATTAINFTSTSNAAGFEFAGQDQAVALSSGAVDIIDQEAPIITSGYIGTAIDENSGAWQVVYTATATDTDFNEAEVIAYSLADNSLGFSIDADTGVVTTNADFAANYEDAESQSQSFTVVATDAAGNSAQQQVNVAINNLDEIAPSITSGDTAIAVNENSGADQVVYTATATDDADTSDGFSFSLADEALGFSIDADTGVVTTNADFAADYENAQSQSFTVVATDVAGNASEQVVSVAINNLDEIAPSITSGDTGTAVNENSGAGQVVYTANATDTDANVEVVTFSLADNTLGFSIDADTGVVTTNADFAADFEAAQSQSFTVVATDIAGNASEQAVTVAVNDLDDSGDDTPTETVINIPELQAATQHVYVSESTKSEDGTQETVVVTYNADAGNTGLGLRIHFDSSAVSVASLDNVLAGTVFANSTPTADTDNKDNDASTDSYIDMAWASLFGGWPGTTPANLATVTFDILEGAPGSTAINFSSSSNASGFEFAGQDQVVVLSSGDVIDEEAPTITSGAEAVVVDTGDTDPVIYTATAVDDGDDAAIVYSLSDTTTYTSVDSGSAESTVTIPELAAATQHVYVSESTKSEDGSQETVVVTYNADAGNTGLGLRIHFDSSAVSVASLTDVLPTPFFANSTPTADTEDKDNDASTDSYIDMAWASLFGGWPGAMPNPTSLATVTFDILEGASGSSAINFSASSSAAGFTFAPENHALALSAETAPVESQLSIDAVTGEVTLSGTLDPDVQSEYSFTVTAADAASNSSDLAVVVDAEQPMVDAAMVVVVDGDTPATPIYQASANIEGVSYQITDLTQYPDAGSGSAESTVTTPELVAATQHVYVSSSTKSDDGTQEVVTVSYNAESNVAGLGVKVHYDSSALTLSDITDVLQTNIFITPDVVNVEADTYNEDGNADTDMLINMAWVSFTGSSWPGSKPADLLTMTFDIAEGASSSVIEFSSSSTAAGFAFDGQDHNLVLAAEAVVPAAELVIDNAAGTVSLDATVNTVVDYSFRVEGTDADGDAIGSQTVPVVVVDQIVNADASSYTGTAGEDVFALADGSAEITSGAGEDDFVLDPAFASASHTITDFESGVDAIDISAALVAAGYTADNAPTQLASAEMSADILDLVNGDDSSLDNLFGATYDEDSNTLTVFADNDSSVGATDMNSIQITLE